ncbi:MAG: hypothetical protein ACKVQR_06870 [Aquabacterium sp.]
MSAVTLDSGAVHRPNDTPEAAGQAASHGWAPVVRTVAAAVAEPLTHALDRAKRMAASGRIERADLQALCDEISAARSAGMMGQQIARLAAGEVMPNRERTSLTQLVRDQIAVRLRHSPPAGLSVRQALAPADIMADPSLIAALVDGLLDWALTHAISGVEFRIEVKPWPMRARLSCRFRHVPADLAADLGSAVQPNRRLDTLSWHLVRQLCGALGATLARQDRTTDVEAGIEFPETLGSSVVSIPGLDVDDGFASTGDSRFLAGNQLLVVAPSRDIRQRVRDALKGLDMIVDYVNSIDAAVQFCRDGLPQAILYQSDLAGKSMTDLRIRARESAPRLPILELVPHGRLVETDAEAVCHIGIDGLGRTLAPTLVAEMSRRS